MNFQLKIGWLYPDLMSTYGDRGNIICLKRRCQWRRININVFNIDRDTREAEIAKCDLIMGGGAQDRQQSIVITDLHQKVSIYKEMFERGVPGLFVCGSPQLLGHYYMTGDGKELEGLGIFDFVTRHFGNDKPRCIGNTVGRLTGDWQFRVGNLRDTIVGFENHGGRTYLGKDVKPFAKVIKGYGNNGEDKTEGAVYKNVIACYFHGPFLPKNPHIADWLISKSLEIRYKKEIKLEPLDDTLEWKAHDFILKKLKVYKVESF
ncbi:cobalamin biosynthesis protein CobQ [Patescibacteria group bacterium]|nr:cobalamin biosynthesis protein CobQ [Patescibacteria group bacterium]MCL5798259.1 cobalamin biosynthesis protein CobQ [Patescibacteria group bacterium]